LNTLHFCREIRYSFCKKIFYTEKLAEKQRQFAELAAIVALKYFLEQQKKVRPVQTVTTNWKTRFFDK
jgi:hypothetical protein